MRIRKRFHLLSSLSTDPLLNNQSSVVQVQVQEEENEENGHSKLQCKKANSQKSDLQNQAFDGQLSVKPTWVSQTEDSLSSSKTGFDLEAEEVNNDEKGVEEEDEEVKKNSRNDIIIIRKECTLNEEVKFSFPSHQVPSNKRKWRLERSSRDDDQYSIPEWKSKTHENCRMFQDDGNLQLLAKTTEENVGDVIGNSSKATKKKKIRGSVILEGSRCSRINGRGWRCCQPTLVGYSLCEHHLGKGRLRSMASSTTVTSPNLKKKQPMGTSVMPPKNDDDDDDDEDAQTQELPRWFRRINKQETLDVGIMDNTKNIDEEDDIIKVTGVAVKKTKKKLGKMRARSMSSLLVAIDNATLAASQQTKKQ